MDLSLVHLLKRSTRPYAKGILTQVIGLTKVQNFWDGFFEQDPNYSLKPVLSKFAKGAGWCRESKQKNDGTCSLYPDNAVLRTFTQTVVQEDNFRFEVFSDPTDSKILGVMIVTD